MAEEAFGSKNAVTSARVLERGVYHGPNLFGPIPMIRFQLDLGSLEAWPTHKIPDFADRLTALLPGLEGHGCSYRVEGGFIRRLREGTWLGHVAEHVALELQSLAGSPVGRGKTRSVKDRPGVYNVLYAYREDEVGFLAGRLALELIQTLLPPDLRAIEGLDVLYSAEDEPELGQPFKLASRLDLLRRVVRRHALGPTTQSLVAEAERRAIPTLRLDDQSFVQLGWGSKQERLRASITGRTSHVAVEAAGNKALTKGLLAAANIPAPRGEVVRTAEEAVRAARRLRGPVVVKPLDGNHGRGVSIGLTDSDAVRQAFEAAARHSRRVIVEQFFSGSDHRILVVDGHVVAVAQRVPAHVVGDGVSTIAALIDQVNADPRRGVGHEKVMTRIKIDDQVTRLLAGAGLDLDSVVEDGRVVHLRETANLSTGGAAIDRTETIHPENACIARRAALTLGLDVAGIDFLCPDITRPVSETGGGIVEVNAAPGFRMHLEPSEGRPRNVARPVIDMLFKDSNGRIPIFAITGTNGKSTTTRMVACILRATGATVGFTSTSGVYINDDRIAATDASGPKSARMVLREPTVDVAVLETARGGILREGLGYDVADIGAVLNVTADHLGLKGVNTVEDLAWVKGVVAENVRRRGATILNADDPLTRRMRRRAGGRVVFFSMRGGDDMAEGLREHIARGGSAVVREPGPNGGSLVLHDGDERRLLMRAADIPATLDGLAEFNIANAVAAAAMTHAHGVGVSVIRGALSTFQSSFEQTPGRLNVFDGHGFRVIVDYAHNAAAFTALTDLIGQLKPRHGRAIAMVSIPGDRRDEDILTMGRLAAGGVFDELVFRETPDGRGRKPGEIIELLERGALTTGFPAQRIHRLRREEDAVDFCLRIARAGDLVVLTPTKVDETWAAVTGFRPGEVAANDSAPAPRQSVNA